MEDEGFKRKLAAILSADVEGYSRLMDEDEEETVRTLDSLGFNFLYQQLVVTSLETGNLLKGI